MASNHGNAIFLQRTKDSSLPRLWLTKTLINVNFEGDDPLEMLKMKIDPTMYMKTKESMTICHAIVQAIYKKMQELHVNFGVKPIFFQKKAENRAFETLDSGKRSGPPCPRDSGLREGGLVARHSSDILT
jgi:hypothetical protein